MQSNQSQFFLSLPSSLPSFEVDAFEWEQGLSQDDRIVLQLRCHEFVKLSALLNQPACLSIQSPGGISYCQGRLVDLQTAGQAPDEQSYSYQAVLRSPLHSLTRNSSCRVFLKVTIKDVITQILEKAGWNAGQFSFRLTQTYPERALVVQHNETDFDFLQCRIAHEGVWFVWEYSSEGYQLIFTDDVRQLSDFVTTSLSYAALSGNVQPTASVFQVSTKVKAITKNVKLRDYNPDEPSNSLLLTSRSSSSISSYGTAYRYGDHFLTESDGKRLLQARQEALDAQRQIFFLDTDDASLQPGQAIKLTQCPMHHYNRTYRIIALTHEGDQSEGKIYSPGQLAKEGHPQKPLTHPTNSENLKTLTYRNRAVCIPMDVAYRAPIPARSKKYHGLGIATIESATNSPYADLDEAGSYRVRFPFDQSDTPKGQASPPLRLAQPHSGSGYGFHAPFVAGTEVLYTCENGDPDRPILLGALPNPQTPTPVTALNASQHVLNTLAGHTLLMIDDLAQPITQLSTPNQQHLLSLDATPNANQIQLLTQQGKMLLQAKQTFATQTGQTHTQQVGKDHHITVKNSHQVTTVQGDIRMQSAQDLKLTTQQGDINLQTQQKNILLSSGQDTLLQAGQGLQVAAQQGAIHISAPQGNLSIKANQGVTLSALGKGNITLTNGGATVQFNTDGSIAIKANQIDFIAKQQHNLVGNQAQLGGHAQPPQKPVVDNIALELKCYYADGTADGKSITTQNAYQLEEPEDQWALLVGNLKPDGTTVIKNVAAGEKALNSNLEVISINKKCQAPWEPVKLSIASNSNNNIPDESRTFKLMTLFPPILLDYTDYCSSDGKSSPPLLTQEELDYFKNNGNNAVIFVHGYNVEFGNFGQQITEVQSNLEGEGYDLFLSSNGYPCTAVRSLEDLHAQFTIPTPVKKIGTFDIDSGLNGTAAHNWLLHMENNLNCAASGNYPFNWEQDALKYSRIIGIHWPGGNHFYEFQEVQEPAKKTGLGLVSLIQQLQQAGITINLIAHSLGTKAALTAMQTLAEPPQSQTDVFEHVFLWEAAVPNDTLSPYKPADLDNNCFPQAYLATKQLTVLFSEKDNVLLMAYRAEMGLKDTGVNIMPGEISMEVLEVLANALHNKPALGSTGVQDQATILKLGTKLQPVSQHDWLKGHGDMRIPSKELFENVYKGWIIGGSKGIQKFGKYDIK